MTALTKAELINNLVSKVGFSATESKEIVDAYFSLIAQGLAKGEGVKISGFGAFRTHRKGPRKGRNLKTGESVEITPRTVVQFHPSEILKDHIIN